MNYFRGICKREECSARALDITKEVISLNGASCSAWFYRWKCLQELDSDLLDELDYIDTMGKTYPKNYQLWWHRRLVVEKIGKIVAERELQCTADALEVDTKNYHIWSYRQWLVRAFQLWEADLAFVHKLLVDDVFNNSAWNQRYFVLTRGGQHAANLTSVLCSELQYVSDMIRIAPLNEAAWSYARALPSGEDSTTLEQLVPLATAILESQPTNLQAIMTLTDAATEMSRAADTSKHDTHTAKALELLHRLVKLDPMRERYWAWQVQELTKARPFVK